MALPPTPVALKSITPYLLRADELRAKEPIIAYWCTYYAAQLGIALKAKDTASRNFLFELLGALEKMKKEIGPTDAIDMEAASAAFVENFALRVFVMADNEDRAGAGNRSTAKKFLAAANFLEVLKTFPQNDVSDSNEEKIRYAKWKAADIAKAYREGRKPTPGPAAGSDLSIDAELSQLQQAAAPSFTSTTSNASSGTIFSGSTPHVTPPAGSPPKVKRTSPRMEPADIANANRDFPPQTPPRNHASGLDSGLRPGIWGGQNAGEATPGSWSTAATPGTSTTPQEGFDVPQSPSPMAAGHTKTGSGSSSGSRNGGLLFQPDGLGNASHPAPPNRPGSNDSGKKSVHFTPSVGGLSSTDGSPPVSPVYYSGAPPEPWQGPSAPAPYGADLPLGFVLDPNQPPSIPGPSQPAFPEPPQPPSSAPPVPPAPGGMYGSAPPLPPQVPTPVVPPPPIFVAPPTLLSPPPPPPPEPEVELTPAVIAKAQKHCRFAISALDYEDAEQARRELRAALAVLGG
ncbi:Vta1 like-domain-containing protein [Mycena sanguinolenta]|nr:Vta1 like-domain-containing protein [Mycena sanguinolenta]